MQTLRKKTSPCKYRNDPGRFFGDGVIFKAKLIGILEVGEARGDRMCQEALQDLKMAIRAAGEHKQRITIHVTLDGLRLRDEKTGDSLYHHPVHKISFIAQDMTDSRAFGYIFGSPDSGHRFFGIKTDKAASQVVLAMRDLFQVVFELKKKEIEMARQQIQSKTIHEHQPIALTVKNPTISEPSNVLSYNKSINEANSKSNAKEMSPESVADLVDLEQELSSIQRGITQMERITPSEPTAGTKSLTEEDPFGDSFTTFPTYNLLPPPESSRSRHSKPVKPPDTIPDVPISSFAPSAPAPVTPVVSAQSSSTTARVSDSWLEHNDVTPIPFESSKPPPHVDGSTTTNTNITATQPQQPPPPPPPSSSSSSSANNAAIQITEEVQMQKTGEDISKTQTATASVAPQTANTQTQYIDAFSDLDPLGTGKSKPYVDKKYFFQELKNPPKKVLKDLSGQDGIFAATFSGQDSNESGINHTNKTDSSSDNKSTAEPFDTPPGSAGGIHSKFNDSKTSEYSHKAYSQSSLFASQYNNSNVGHNDKVFNIDLERAKIDAPIMMPRDTDPFSPTRKKSDPFQEGDIFSKLDPFEFDFSNKQLTNDILPETKITSTTSSLHEESPSIKSNKKDGSVFNGPLQVSLPPESWSSNMAQKKIERQTSESPTSATRNRPSVFKQNTVDVISSISSKKMPHLFGQKFSKRDSNSINMRRLQESDSLSENETAPEPPPRPESASYVEPPPLPPKKQFSDIVIRPRITSSSAVPPPIRYDYVTSRIKSSSHSLDSAPPIPLPSRKVGRTDSMFPGPGRPARKPGEEEDYLTPLSARSDVPPLLPPPQTKGGRGRRLEHVEQHKTEIEIPAPAKTNQLPPEAIIPDITLSQLLTLGIDELAVKLNVPTSKLNTMTLVELTTYLSDFIENSRRVPVPSKEAIPEPPIFKVNFDQHSDATFVAKFDDNFGEESTPFVANFSNFDVKPESPVNVTTVPPADRYAVFREIIDQEFPSDGTELQSSIERDDDFNIENDSDKQDLQESAISNTIPMQVAKIDTKITEAISQAKDRYAALRDIILVEDLFDKSTRPSDAFPISDDLLGSEAERDEERDIFQEMDNDKSINEDSSPENNQIFDNIETICDTRRTPEIRQNGMLIQTGSNKDDIEIDELMNRAISNLSLNSRDNLSPISATKSPVGITAQNASTSPISMQQNKSPIISLNSNQITASKSQFNDMSTSPIPLQKLPAQKSPISKSPLSKSPISKSPIPQSQAVASLIDASKRANSGSLSDVVCGSSPETNGNILEPIKSGTASAEVAESWAIFDTPADNKKIPISLKSPRVGGNKEVAESPCSSDGKDEWKNEQDYGKRWPKGQTSSSSRDLSPWDDETSDYKKRQPPPGADRHGYYMRHARRMNSCDDEYDYDDEISKRRDRRIKSAINRSRENFDSDSQNWYHPSNHHNWSPPEDEDGRPRPFDRSSYERSTYGPPYDKRDHKMPCIPYDRRDYKNYDKRKYYREYSRPDYDFEPYAESPDVVKDRKLNYYGDSFEKPIKSRRDYENIYEDEFSREGRSSHKSREYFYDRDRKSFDRESIESYESGGRRHKSFGSGDVYGSLDSREEFRERYLGPEKTRSLRKGMKIRGGEEYEQDSENDVQLRRGPGDTRSLQRPPQCARIRKSSGSSPWDGEEIPPNPGQKGWKRPSSASESERRLAENRRVLSHTLSGSDGEKDRRFRKKPRSRGKEIDSRQQNFGTIRYPSGHRDSNYDYIDYDDYEQPMDEDKFERLNRRRQDMHQRMMECERRKKVVGEKFNFDDDEGSLHPLPKHNQKKDLFYSEKDRYAQKFDAFEEPTLQPPPSKNVSKPVRREFDFDDFEETPRSNASSSKFNFEEHGFESDFNSPPPPTATTTSGSNVSKSSFRFSNDFSEKDNKPTTTTPATTVSAPTSAGVPLSAGPGSSSYETEFNQTPTQKLRFDENVTISKFDSDEHHHHHPNQQQHPSSQQQQHHHHHHHGSGNTVGSSAFEDDFSKAEFLFENEDQWNNELPKKNSLRLTKRQENIKKSESVNIFARKSEDPFEDDDFFKTSSSGNDMPGQQQPQHHQHHAGGNKNKTASSNNNNNNNGDESFQWDNNFAKFDENM